MLKSARLSVGIWGWSVILIAVGCFGMVLYLREAGSFMFVLMSVPAAAIGGLPALVVLLVVLPFIQRSSVELYTKAWRVVGLLLLISLLYGLGAFIMLQLFDRTGSLESLQAVAAIVGGLFVVSTIALFIQHNTATKWLGAYPATLWTILSNPSFHHQQIHVLMNDSQNPGWEPVSSQPEQTTNSSNSKNVIKAAITAALILAMLIPAQFVSSLVAEREKRQQEVVQEVSSKWASAQTVSTPYLCIPYNEEYANDTGRIVKRRTMIFKTANSLDVQAELVPELRKRSIYDVLLYKSNIQIKGSMNYKPGKDIKPENLLLNEARLCIGISDFKGIEEKIATSFNDSSYEMEPGLPDYSIDKQGLSVPVVITADQLSKDLPFSLNIQLKGSEQLHFLPLSDNSRIQLKSTWPDPSFDGSSLPRQREVSDSGFVASWSFNKANMPVLDQILKTDANRESMAFGVSMIQPADQYAKTNRSIKYAILFVGLTFAMFFIIELMQKKNVHPVQYLLVGLALIIFYTLLLSISEYTGFNSAYAIAAGATISLVAVYASSLFASVKTSIVLALFMALLYGFIYVLIQLEDTALLAGSIGLFIILAVAMYFSRRINWFGNNVAEQALAT